MARFSLAPLTSRILARLRRGGASARSSWKFVEVCGAETGERPEAVALPGQLERVVSVQEDTTLEYELTRLSAGPACHAPTLAFTLEDAFILDGVVHCGNARWECVVDRERVGPYFVEQEIESLSMCSTPAGSRYFGHLILDDCSTVLLAREFDRPGFFPGPSMSGPHVPFYLQSFGIDPQFVRTAFVRRLRLFQDYAMTSSKVARIRALRAALTTLTADRAGVRVFVRRGVSGARRLLANEGEIERKLALEGFDILDPACLSAEQILRRARDASIVVGVEGSALMHGLMAMRDRGGIVCLQPPDRFNNVFKDYTDALGMTYGYVVAGRGDGRVGFSISPEEVLRTVELVARRIEA